MTGLRVAIMTDETGWHTRQLQKALRAARLRSAAASIWRTAASTRHDKHGMAWSFPALAARSARRRAGARHRQRNLRAGHQASGRVARAARTRCADLQRCACDRTQRRQVDDQPAAACGAASPRHRPGPPSRQAQAQRIAVREGAAGHALVLKPLFGSQGKGLRLVGHVDGVHHAATREIEQGVRIGLAYLQRFIAAADCMPGFRLAGAGRGRSRHHRDAAGQCALGSQRRARGARCERRCR